MFFITDHAITDVKLSNDHIYTGLDPDKKQVQAKTSVTSLISGVNDYSDKRIKASSELSVEIHARVAGILKDASRYARDFWKEKPYGTRITSRTINYLQDRIVEIKEKDPLTANLIGHVITILNKNFSLEKGYLMFVTEKPMICEFLFHNANVRDFFSFSKVEDPDKIKGQALIGGTPDLIIFEQDFDSELNTNVKYDFVIVDFKNITQEKFSQWQMQMFIYKEMLEAKLKQRGNPHYCQGLYIANSVDTAPLLVHTNYGPSEQILKRKFRDLYLQQYNKKELNISDELREEIAEAIKLKVKLQENERRHKILQKGIEDELAAETSNIKNKLEEYTKEELALISTNGDITLERSGKYRTAINMKKAAEITHLRETTHSGYTTKLKNEYGAITFDDSDEVKDV